MARTQVTGNDIETTSLTTKIDGIDFTTIDTDIINILSVEPTDTATLFGDYSGSDSIFHMRIGNGSGDLIRIESWDGASATSLMEIGQDTVTITGNLVVSGTTTTINSETLDVADNTITLNSGVTGAPTLDAFIIAERGSSTDAKIRWNETDDAWELDAGAGTSTLFVTSGGVGIGTVSPGSELEIDDGGGASGHPLFTLQGRSYVGYINRGGDGAGLLLDGGTSKRIFFDTDSSQRMVIDDAGNVGIGMNAPGTKLEVRSTASGAMLTLDNTTTASWIIFEEDTVARGYLGYGASGLVDVYPAVDDMVLRSQNSLIFATGGGNTRMTILSDGNVGIGTNSPAAKLEVTDGYIRALNGNNPVPATGMGLEIVTTGGESYIVSYDRDGVTYEKLHIRAKDIILNSDPIIGNVGIGTNSPAFPLQIGTGSMWSTYGGGLGIKGQAAGSGSVNIVRMEPDNTDSHIFAISYNHDTSKSSLSFGATPGAYDLKIAEDGKVGIGTDSPGMKLVVESSENIVARFYSTHDTYGARIIITASDAAVNERTWSLSALENGNFSINQTADSTAVDYAKGITIDQNGDVGIGVNSYSATPACKLDVNGAIKSGQSTINTGTHDALDVSAVNSVRCNTSGGNITIGGLANGIDGQVVRLIKNDSLNDLIIEHNEGTGTQKIITPDSADITLTNYGGVTLVMSSTLWYVVRE